MDRARGLIASGRLLKVAILRMIYKQSYAVAIRPRQPQPVWLGFRSLPPHARWHTSLHGCPRWKKWLHILSTSWPAFSMVLPGGTTIGMASLTDATPEPLRRYRFGS